MFRDALRKTSTYSKKLNIHNTTGTISTSIFFDVPCSNLSFKIKGFILYFSFGAQFKKEGSLLKLKKVLILLGRYFCFVYNTLFFEILEIVCMAIAYEYMVHKKKNNKIAQ